MTHVKICGITNLDDAVVAAQAGADLIGFVFYDKSPRFVQPEQARDIMSALRKCEQCKYVGVFVNDSLERVRDVMETARLDIAQLHGDESAAIVSLLSPHACKALRLCRAGDARAAIVQYHAAVSGNVPAFVVDAYDAGKFGGTGARVDWTIAAQLAHEYPILLAGGLNVDNVAEAIRIVRPWGVDVSSGVERAPGLKDHMKVREFIRRAKNGLVGCTP